MFCKVSPYQVKKVECSYIRRKCGARRPAGCGRLSFQPLIHQAWDGTGWRIVGLNCAVGGTSGRRRVCGAPVGVKVAIDIATFTSGEPGQCWWIQRRPLRGPP